MRQFLGILAAAGLVVLGPGVASAQDMNLRVGPGGVSIEREHHRPAYRERVIERRVVERPVRSRTVCRLAIAGPLNLVSQIQWYDFRAQSGGILESDPHPSGTVEQLYLLKGEIEVTAGDDTKRLKIGEALRFRGDLPHRIVNVGEGEAHATMVLVIRQLGNGPDS